MVLDYLSLILNSQVKLVIYQLHCNKIIIINKFKKVLCVKLKVYNKNKTIRIFKE